MTRYDDKTTHLIEAKQSLALVLLLLIIKPYNQENVL